MVTSLLLNVNIKQSMYDMYVCAVRIIRSGQVISSCYHDREQHLRRDDHRRQGRAELEGIARYVHQGGGQRQAGQGKVS